MTPEYIRSTLDYEPETGVFRWKNRVDAPSFWNGRHAGNVAGTIDRRGYGVIKINYKRLFAHRLAWAHFYGVWPCGQLDHINRIRNDNRIANLRECSPTENASNRGPSLNSASGIKGVCWSKSCQKWQANISVNRKRIHLGVFADIESAASARQRADLEYFGEFACVENIHE